MHVLVRVININVSATNGKSWVDSSSYVLWANWAWTSFCHDASRIGKLNQNRWKVMATFSPFSWAILGVCYDPWVYTNIKCLNKYCHISSKLISREKWTRRSQMQRCFFFFSYILCFRRFKGQRGEGVETDCYHLVLKLILTERAFIHTLINCALCHHRPNAWHMNSLDT